MMRGHLLESGRNRGRPRGQSFRIGNNVSEVREPPVEVFGQIVVQNSGADLELALADDLDAAANLFFGRELVRRWGPFRTLDKRAMQSQAKEIIASFGVDIPTVRAHVRTPSGGQRQAVAIDRAVGWGPPNIVMDAPPAALGVTETARIEGVIQSLRDRGLAILLAQCSGRCHQGQGSASQ
jgi:ABC-type uncharacterized transport system ATPase subunit